MAGGQIDLLSAVIQKDFCHHGSTRALVVLPETASASESYQLFIHKRSVDLGSWAATNIVQISLKTQPVCRWSPMVAQFDFCSRSLAAGGSLHGPIKKIPKKPPKNYARPQL